MLGKHESMSAPVSAVRAVRRRYKGDVITIIILIIILITMTSVGL